MEISVIFLLSLSLGHGYVVKHHRTSDERVTYKRQDYLRIYPNSVETLQWIYDLDTEAGDRMKIISSRTDDLGFLLDIIVAVNLGELIKMVIEPKGGNVMPVIKDVQKVIDEFTQLNAGSIGENFRFDQYHTYDEILQWYKNKATTYPQLFTALIIGQTHEGNDIIAIKISSPMPGRRRAIWLDSGIHANEWVGPATLVYFIEKMLTGYGQDPEVTEMLDNFDFYLLPVFNVDGYKYTWTTDRMWRKNRAPQVDQNGTCMGVDLNRNWGVKWGEVNAQFSPCSANYVGTSAFSEPETRSVSRFLRQNNASIISYVAYHSFSEFWMTPYSYSVKENPSNIVELLSMSAEIASAIESVHGVKYRVGRVPDLIAESGGASIDYTHSELNIPYSFGVELRDSGRFATLLPPEYILPNAEESWAGVVRLAQLLNKKGY